MRQFNSQTNELKTNVKKIALIAKQLRGILIELYK